MFLNGFIDGLTEPPEVSNPDDEHFESVTGARAFGRRMRDAYELTTATIALLFSRNGIDYVDNSDEARRDDDERNRKGDEALAKYEAKKAARKSA